MSAPKVKTCPTFYWTNKTEAEETHGKVPLAITGCLSGSYVSHQRCAHLDASSSEAQHKAGLFSLRTHTHTTPFNLKVKQRAPG